MRPSTCAGAREERRVGLQGLRPESTWHCCGPKGSWLGGSEGAKVASENGCWPGGCHCPLVLSAWRGVMEVGGTRSGRVRNAAKEVKLGARQAKSEERASYLRLEVGGEESVSAKVRELVGPPLWG